ncbi:MAG: cache domain-containing protein [Pseudomonadota bacterium]
MSFRFFALAALAGLPLAVHATPEDNAVQLVKKAAAHIKANGLERACTDFGDPAKGFLAGESYVYVHDLHGKMLCNPGSPRTVGKDLIEMKDVDGKQFNKEMLQVAKQHGSGWVEYKWVNPLTKQIQQKKSYVEKQDQVVIGSGFYK